MPRKRTNKQPRKTSNKTIFMPAAMLEAWLNALLHGDYKQAQSTLYDSKSGGFCCLGVLQHANCDGQVEVGEHSGEFLSMPSDEWLRERGIVFLDVYKKFSDSPYLPKLGDDAAGANDSNVSFDKIAKAIKAAAVGY